jgi:hypothetical protein
LNLPPNGNVGVEIRPSQQIRVQRVDLGQGANGRVTATCLVAQEVDTPRGVEPIEWRLLSNREATTLEQAVELIDWHRVHGYIEHSFREAKSECGLADYQVRRWDAWHHHMALVMLGTLLLVKQKSEGRNQWPMLSFNDLVTALAHLLPRRQLTAEDLAAIITKRHRLRQQAKASHARRSMAALE